MSSVKELEDKVKELTKVIETLKQKEKTEEFEYPFEDNEDYWVVKEHGLVGHYHWNSPDYDNPLYEQGHVFKTKQEAERERDRRALLTRFRQFRDKCNGDWKPTKQDYKYFIMFDLEDKSYAVGTEMHYSSLPTLGHFKNKKDAKRAIELFGDEIKRLWVDE